MAPYLKHLPKTPGAWMRRALVQKSLTLVIISSSGLGALVLWVTLTIIPASTDSIAIGIFVFWTVSTSISLLVINYWPGSYGISNLEKGLDAEMRIGKHIEFAITRPNYAVAHNLEIDEAEAGDIDHLVATPDELVVVETKFRDLPEDQFAEARNRLARNIKAVRKWASSSTQVRGAIVYMNLEHHKESEYPTLGEDIRVYKSESFAKGFRKGMQDDATRPHVKQVREAGLSQ